jgi:hypothetical protein
LASKLARFRKKAKTRQLDAIAWIWIGTTNLAEWTLKTAGGVGYFGRLWDHHDWLLALKIGVLHTYLQWETTASVNLHFSMMMPSIL